MNNSIFNAIQFYIEKGLSVEDAIKEVERVTFSKTPDNIVILIRQKFG